MSVYDAAAVTDVLIPVRTRAQRFRRRYGLATFGAVIVVAWVVITLFAPWLTLYSPDTVDVANRLQPPSWAHWFGTDALGRDVYTCVIFGARVSLTTGFVVVLAAGVLGTLLGAIAAYARGWVEESIMRCTDLVLCFPPIILALAIAAALGIGTPEWGSMIAEGRELVAQWWVATFPGAAILSVVIGFNFLGDGIRDWLDPKARKR